MAAVLSIFKSVVVSVILFTCCLSSCNGSGSVQGNNYYRVELIRRESARSPLMKPQTNLTMAERVRLSVERSKRRLKRLQAMARGGRDNLYSPVIPNDGEFVMQIGIGHPTPLLLHTILDTAATSFGCNVNHAPCVIPRTIPCTISIHSPPPRLSPARANSGQRLPRQEDRLPGCPILMPSHASHPTLYVHPVTPYSDG